MNKKLIKQVLDYKTPYEKIKFVRPLRRKPKGYSVLDLKKGKNNA